MRRRPSNVPGSGREAAPSWRRGGADLHVHTTHSDGACSPCEVVVAAARVGLSALAITDHDTISALAVARPEARHWSVELIAGIELSCRHRGRELHILGYFFREDDPSLAAAIDRLREGRARRVETMAARLQDLGLRVDLEAVRRAFPRATLGRRHLAEHLARTGQVGDLREAFLRFLADGRPACVEKTHLDAVAAIELLGRAGGVAALAHPPHDFGESAIRALANAGLRAIEVDGPGCSRSLGRRLRAIADRLDLIGIAGSDFHAPDRPGRWVGAITTDPEVVERLRDAVGARKGTGPSDEAKDIAPACHRISAPAPA
jgi:3',5'-nucleoside bisphosphate phosphatase